MEKYKNIADDLKSKSEGLEVQVLTLKKVSNFLWGHYGAYVKWDFHLWAWPQDWPNT